MAGYSKTSLPKKLGIKDLHRVALVKAPRAFNRTLGALPAGAKASAGLRGKSPYDVIVAFVRTDAELADILSGGKRRLDPAGGIWLAWPKKTSPLATDMNREVVRAALLDAGLVDNKVCAIDDDWSALRAVIRVKDRPKGRKPS